MIGQHLYTSSWFEYGVKGKNPGTFTVAFDDAMFSENERQGALRAIEAKCECPASVRPLLTDGAGSILRIYHPTPNTTVAGRTYWVGDRITGRGSRVPYTHNFILSNGQGANDNTAFLNNPANAFRPDYFLPYQDFAAKVNENPDVPAVPDDKYARRFGEPASEFKPDFGIFNKLGFNEDLFIAWLGELVGAIEKNRIIAVLTPPGDFLRNAESAICATLAILPVSFRRKFGAVSCRDALAAGENEAGINLYFAPYNDAGQYLKIINSGAVAVDLVNARTNGKPQAEEYARFVWKNLRGAGGDSGGADDDSGGAGGDTGGADGDTGGAGGDTNGAGGIDGFNGFLRTLLEKREIASLDRLVNCFTIYMNTEISDSRIVVNKSAKQIFSAAENAINAASRVFAGNVELFPQVGYLITDSIAILLKSPGAAAQKTDEALRSLLEKDKRVPAYNENIIMFLLSRILLNKSSDGARSGLCALMAERGDFPYEKVRNAVDGLFSGASGLYLHKVDVGQVRFFTDLAIASFSHGDNEFLGYVKNRILELGDAAKTAGAWNILAVILPYYEELLVSDTASSRELYEAFSILATCLYKSDDKCESAARNIMDRYVTAMFKKGDEVVSAFYGRYYDETYRFLDANILPSNPESFIKYLYILYSFAKDDSVIRENIKEFYKLIAYSLAGADPQFYRKQLATFEELVNTRPWPTDRAVLGFADIEQINLSKMNFRPTIERMKTVAPWIGFVYTNNSYSENAVSLLIDYWNALPSAEMKETYFRDVIQKYGDDMLFFVLFVKYQPDDDLNALIDMLQRTGDAQKRLLKALTHINVANDRESVLFEFYSFLLRKEMNERGIYKFLSNSDWRFVAEQEKLELGDPYLKKKLWPAYGARSVAIKALEEMAASGETAVELAYIEQGALKVALKIEKYMSRDLFDALVCIDGVDRQVAGGCFTELRYEWRDVIKNRLLFWLRLKDAPEIAIAYVLADCGFTGFSADAYFSLKKIESYADRLQACFDIAAVSSRFGDAPRMYIVGACAQKVLELAAGAGEAEFAVFGGDDVAAGVKALSGIYTEYELSEPLTGRVYSLLSDAGAGAGTLAKYGNLRINKRRDFSPLSIKLFYLSAVLALAGAGLLAWAFAPAAAQIAGVFATVSVLIAVSVVIILIAFRR